MVDIPQSHNLAMHDLLTSFTSQYKVVGVEGWSINCKTDTRSVSPTLYDAFSKFSFIILLSPFGRYGVNEVKICANF